jgi:hypothetical protein
MADVGTVVVPLATAFGGLLLGSFFSRVTSRNDTRRDRYAAALTAVTALIEANEAGDEVARAAARLKIRELADWIALDSPAVSRTYAKLVTEATTASSVSAVQIPRAAYLADARAFSTWALPRRYILQLGRAEPSRARSGR